jgi:hypothetical protein
MIKRKLFLVLSVLCLTGCDGDAFNASVPALMTAINSLQPAIDAFAALLKVWS